MYGTTDEHYAVDDDILPTLDSNPEVEVRIDIDATAVKLFIGPREYEWPRGCPDVCSVKMESYERFDGPQREDL